MQLALYFLLLCFYTKAKTIDNDDLAETEEINRLLSSMFSVYDKELVYKYREKTLADVINMDNNATRALSMYIANGTTAKGRTFNVYDDDMRQAAIELFTILKEIPKENQRLFFYWAKANINDAILEYSIRLAQTFSNNLGGIVLPAPFSLKPSFYFNSESIRKATKIALLNGQIDQDDAQENEYFKIDNVVSINTNYSGWNLLGNGCEEETAYFREDTSLNAYYYAMSLLHPFWMKNQELENIDPRFAEYYFFIHKQLLARYRLERKKSFTDTNDNCRFSDYNPYLEYQNGLSFPTRKIMQPDPNDSKTSDIVSKTITLQSFISRGFVLVDNATNSRNRVEITPENHISLITKMIREFFEKPRTAKITRSLYGANGYPEDRYDVAPSVMHHPETTLRDPEYWNLMNKITSFIQTYQQQLEYMNLSDIASTGFKIISVNVPVITTYYENYQSDITKAVPTNSYKTKLMFTARQKRLNHRLFNITINIWSDLPTADVIIRLFLQPNEEVVYPNNMHFFELDVFPAKVELGSNTIIWSTSTSSRYASDDDYNIENIVVPHVMTPDTSNYDLYKFPKRLAIPKGSEYGSDYRLFAMVTARDDKDKDENNVYLSKVTILKENKPFGYPFHIPVALDKVDADNYKFVKVTIIHENDIE